MCCTNTYFLYENVFLTGWTPNKSGLEMFAHLSQLIVWVVSLELDAVGGTSGVADVKLCSVYPLLAEVVVFDLGRGVCNYL